nr:unnamed protein product [Naegleria fowleri]
MLTQSLDSQKPMIASTFSDIKEQLKYLSKQEWANIPEVSGSTTVLKNPNRMNQQMYERYTATPDHLILDQFNTTLSGNSLSGGGSGGVNSIRTSSTGQSGTLTDLRALGEMRESIIKTKLQSLEESVGGKSTIDPKNYMSGLESQIVLGTDQYADIKRYRKLFKKATKVKPMNASSWIGRARLEELAGDLKKACHIIAKGCHCVKNSEELWLESIRLHLQYYGGASSSATNPMMSNSSSTSSGGAGGASGAGGGTHSLMSSTMDTTTSKTLVDTTTPTPTMAQSICCEAIEHLPHSVKLWLKASELESDLEKKKKILRKALSTQPQSIQLWKEAIELEQDENNAKTLLERAIECIPTSVELWLALAKLNDYGNAKKILSRAVSKLPKEPQIWISGAYLEEEHNPHNESVVRNLIKKAIDTLKKLLQVTASSTTTTTTTSSSTTTTHGSLSREEWMEYAKQAEKTHHILTCRAIIEEIISYGLNDMTEKEKKHIYLNDAHACASQGYTETARAIYDCARKEFPSKKSVWLNSYEFESCCCERSTPTSAAPTLLSNVGVLTDTTSTPDTTTTTNTTTNTTTSITTTTNTTIPHTPQQERLQQLLSQATTNCPNCEDLWLIRAKYEWKVFNHIENARQVLEEAFKTSESNQNNENIWLAFVKLEFENEEYLRARLLLEHARNHFLKSSSVGGGNNSTSNNSNNSTSSSSGSSSASIWIRSAQFERRVFHHESMKRILLSQIEMYSQKEHHDNNTTQPLPQHEEPLSLQTTSMEEFILTQALEKYPKEHKLWLMRGQYEEEVLYSNLNAFNTTNTNTANTINTPTTANTINTTTTSNTTTLTTSNSNTTTSNTTTTPTDSSSSSLQTLIDKSCKIYEDGLKHCPHSIPLWLSLFRLYFNPLVLPKSLMNITKARALLDRALLKNPSSASLWLALMKLEYHQSNSQMDVSTICTPIAMTPTLLSTCLATLSKGIQSIQSIHTSKIGNTKNSIGVLWSFTIPLEIVQKRKAAIANALKHCDRDPYVILQIALDFYRERRFEKAKEWLRKALTVDPKNGDLWILLYRMEWSSDSSSSTLKSIPSQTQLTLL